MCFAKITLNLRLILSFIILLVLIGACFYLGDLFVSSGKNLLEAVSHQPLKEAYYYQKLDKQSVQCQLCPRQCIIAPGKRGFCRVRENIEGILYSLVYAQPCAVHIDPIEKKPLFHFLPSSSAFSVATAGCNFKCAYCQNWQISQARPEEVDSVYLPAQELVKKALESGCLTIAYTYSEPVIFYEYMLESAKLAKASGIRNVMHSNGFINEQPLRELCKYLDAANIDLKGFSQKHYREIALGDLEAVLRTLKILKQEGVWVEITNLILPGFNDGEEEISKMCLWIRENLGEEVPVHFSRFWPMYKLLSLSPMPISTLQKARKIALDCGLKYVYLGNVTPGHSAENTFCPNCGNVVIKRNRYTILEVNLDAEGGCKLCGEKIEGIWK
ncbi:MAG: AmmeMemoRadiSam system radical SAM enzyme [Candidatus Omnitrophica bacterium]|nr:AmmeMemoRadiSam system radical SAM enzyme [Candidatus Omnitrophota bacterium]